MASGRRRPNILLLHSDQHRYDCVAVNGHPLLRTPHLDRLAAEGVNFSHAFTPTPICSPARTSLMTGQWPTQHLNINLVGGTEAPRPAPSELPTFSRLLREAGYYLGYVGKWHVDVDAVRSPTHDDYGFHDYVPERDYIAWRREQGIAPWPGLDKQTEGLTLDFFFGRVDPHATAEQTKSAWLADRTIEMLRAAAATDAPFFIRFDPSEPHLPNIVPEPYASLYPTSEIKPWPGFADPLIDKPWIQAEQRRTWGVEGWGWEQWAPIVGRYLGEITLLDEQIGRILGVIDELGLADDTVVVYSTDHGDLCGSHGMMDKHFVMYDDVTRVPLILRWPAGLPAGELYDGFVCQEIDLAATFLDVAGLDRPSTFAGESLVSYVADAVPARPDILSTYHGCQMGLYSQRMLRERQWKLVYNATDRDELYDLVNDPGELFNRYDDPALGQERSRLLARLVSWMRETGDPLLNTFTAGRLGIDAAQR